MVDKDICTEGINRFLRTQNHIDALVLLDYLCDIKNLPNKEEAVKSLDNPTLMTTFLPHIIEELIKEFNLIKVSDRYNTLILVF